MMAYIGAEGFLVNAELREGKQHSQKHTPEFLQETLALAHKLTDEQFLVRLGFGIDAAENIGILLESGSWFIIKRNLRCGESKEDWLEKAKGCCKDIRHPRQGKTVYVGSSWKDVSCKETDGNTKTVYKRVGYEVNEKND